MKHYISAAANARIVHQDVPLRHHQAMHPMLWASQETVMTKQRKKTWTDYVNTFIQPNPDIPLDYFGKWNEIIKRVDTDNRTNERSLTLKDTTNEANQDINLETLNNQRANQTQSENPVPKGWQEAMLARNKATTVTEADIELKEPTELDF